MKQTLQYLVFPDGILYNKQNTTFRTQRVNLLFNSISYLARVSHENKKDNLLQDCLFGSNVGMATASSNLILEDIAGHLSF